MELTVARIVRAHGLRGEVLLDVRTDDPGRRLAPGRTLATVPPAAGPLTVGARRELNGRTVVRFRGVDDRDAAESLRGVELVIEPVAGEEEDAWYSHELAGLRAERPDGTLLGTVQGLEDAPAHDLLVVSEPDGTRTLVPFVHALVPVVDVAGGRVVIDPPGGMFAAGAEVE